MRYIAFFMTFILLLCPVMVMAADISSNEHTDLSGDYLEFIFDNQQSIPNEHEIKIAVYDDEGKMVSLQNTIVSGWKTNNKVPIELDHYMTIENKGTTLKAFFIHPNTLTPYATSAIIGKSTCVLDTPSSTDDNVSVTVEWANEHTIAFTPVSLTNQPICLTVHVPDSWDTGATYRQGTYGGIVCGFKRENNKQYVLLENLISGKQVILQKRISNIIKNLETPIITTFYENKTGAVSVTFDDGDYNSAVFYDSEFAKYGFHGTAFLITNRLTGIDNWKTLLEKGLVDVGNHSASHQLKYSTDAATLTSEQIQADISGSYDNLKKYFPEQSILTFASPWGQTTNTVITEMKKNHYANRKAGGGLQNNNPQGDDWFKLNAFVYNGHDTKAMNGWADQAINNKGWAIELLHNCIDGTTPNGLTIAKDIFSEHMAYLNTKKDQLWMGSFNEVTAYIKERESATVTIISANDTTMTLSLTDTLPNDRFIQPLSILVHVPSHWVDGVSYSQGSLFGKSDIVKSENGKLYVQINAIPDKGEILLQKN
ncbi:MAG: hypothetical protein E7399_05580 [Ruminococcaceae bacterium]|nr:hypothetical protein [Oscillospiraceae bacterium]